MITRITRGTLRPNSEQRVFDVLRRATQASPNVSGLSSMSISRKVGANGVELVAVTIWSDVEVMARVLGSRWAEPSWLPGLDECVESSSVEMLETVVSSVNESSELTATA